MWMGISQFNCEPLNSQEFMELENGSFYSVYQYIPMNQVAQQIIKALVGLQVEIGVDINEKHNKVCGPKTRFR